MRYLDTSVLAAYYCPEPLSDIVEEYIAGTRQPAVSRLTEVELASAVSRKIREKSLSQQDGARILNTFQAHRDEGLFHCLPIESRHYRQARSWISRFAVPLRTLDALHLAVSAAPDIEMLTADVRLADAARHFGIEVVLIK